jgi:hypothetical protein
MVQMPQKIENAQNTPNIDRQRRLKHTCVPCVLVARMDGLTLLLNAVATKELAHYSEPIGQTATFGPGEIFHSANLNAHVLQCLLTEG